ncbi:hypothetical protein J8273_4202 [Carpediemonas membranifera]|uniref:PCI domain-containing protein n=1 Tax=Carpediemonas membranifera TaxID=201153 RepID=A0A8J6AUJ0_9EUKA|nr:hypothetical protein J8273_4202 [Carpediemonas membranifera]|eukprot:KAG9394528.1 hypothetical protein J8273_4202 [Carpediemonas membranifera]
MRRRGRIYQFMMLHTSSLATVENIPARVQMHKAVITIIDEEVDDLSEQIQETLADIRYTIVTQCVLAQCENGDHAAALTTAEQAGEPRPGRPHDSLRLAVYKAAAALQCNDKRLVKYVEDAVPAVSSGADPRAMPDLAFVDKLFVVTQAASQALESAEKFVSSATDFLRFGKTRGAVSERIRHCFPIFRHATAFAAVLAVLSPQSLLQSRVLANPTEFHGPIASVVSEFTGRSIMPSTIPTTVTEVWPALDQHHDLPALFHESVAERNIVAMSKVFKTVGVEAMASALGLGRDTLVARLSKMVRDGRLEVRIDLGCGVVRFIRVTHEDWVKRVRVGLTGMM